MFHTSVINKGKDNVFGWNNKKRCVFSITDTIWQSNALPLHPSQEILTDNAEELVIRLHLTPSYDFDQKLLSLGNRVQVIEPQWYREHIIMRLKQALDNYE